MATEKELSEFWELEIKPRFRQEDLDTKVTLADGSEARYVNLDNAATTTPFLKVIEELGKEMSDYGSVHRGAGFKSKISTERYDATRNTIKRFVNAPDSNYVIFTSNTTAGMNQLAYFFAHINGKIMVSDIEHSSSLLPFVYQEGRHSSTEQVSLEDTLQDNAEDNAQDNTQGNTFSLAASPLNALKSVLNTLNTNILERGKLNVITYKTKQDFTFDLDDIERTLKIQASKGDKEKIKLCVVTAASNVTGYKPQLKELSKLAHKYGAMIVADCCQLLQHEQVDMQETGLDFIVFSGHKMYAPFGTGVIVGDRRIFDAFWPYQMGGGNFTYINRQGDVFRCETNQAHDPGTPNFAGARAIHHAIKELENIGVERIAYYEHALALLAFEELEKINGVTLYVEKDTKNNTLKNTESNPKPLGSPFDRSLITFNIKGMPHKLVSEILNYEYGIGTRAGSYCVYEYSRKINGITNDEDSQITSEAIGCQTSNIPGSVRASFGLVNSVDDIKRFINAVSEISKKNLDYHTRNYELNEKTGDWKPKFHIETNSY